MKIKYYKTLIITSFIILSSLYNNNLSAQRIDKDSIINNIRDISYRVSSNKPNYHAEIYSKGILSFKKKNFLSKLTKYLKKIEKGDYFVELYGNLSFTNPNIYNCSFSGISTNNANVKGHIERIFTPLLQGNVYGENVFGKTVSPISKKGNKYYYFSLDNNYKGEDEFVKINFKPKFSNNQFISGYYIINYKNNNIRELYVKGEIEMVKYTSHFIMGEEGTDEQFLTKEHHITINMGVVGNKISGKYSIYIDYSKIIPFSEITYGLKPRSKYDLTIYYNIDKDTTYTNSHTGSGLDFSKIRSVPLTEEELTILQDTTFKERPIEIEKRSSNFFTKSRNVEIQNVGNLQLFPIISPLLLDYSTKDGLSYKQKLKYTRSTKGGGTIYIEPFIGYSFSDKEFFWGAKGEYRYKSVNNGKLTLNFGTGNNFKTTKIVDALNLIPDKIFDESRLHLEEYRNFNYSVTNFIEPFNGFSVSTNITIQNYRAKEKSNFTVINPNSNYIEQAQKIARNHYNYLVPEVIIAYTPGCYYYYNNKHKENLFSKYPSFSLTWAHCFKDIFNSYTKYDRVEFDLQHKITINPSETIYYRVGGGEFFNSENLIFTEFSNLKRSPLPLGWSDDVSGTFQLLDGSDKRIIERYFRIHARYDAPFLLIPTLLRKVKFIKQERIYSNLIFTDKLNPFLEVGYGIATGIFNVGLFWGGEVNKMNKFSLKVAIEMLH